MGHCLLYSLLVLSTTAIPSVEASADQGGRLIGVHGSRRSSASASR
jgi:hypothetical protein